jgi:hypothetical protein
MPDAEEELILQKKDWPRQLSGNHDIQAFKINLTPRKRT